MRCLVTGATGFIGSATTRQLVANGHTVVGLTSDPGKVDTLAAAGVEPLVGDLREPQAWLGHAREVDAIVHLATLSIPSRPGTRYVKDLVHVQERVTEQLLNAASGHCTALVYTSAASVYGASPTPSSEQSPLDPCRLALPFVAGERLIQRAAADRAIPGVVLRLAGVYGFGGVFGRFWAQPMAAGKRTGIPGTGRQLYSFVHIDDCARAFVRAVEHPMPGEVFNIADDQPVPLGTMLQACADALQAPQPRNIPAPLFRTLAGTTVAELLLQDKAISNHKMLEQLGVELRYPTYRDGIAALAHHAQDTPAQRPASR
jgi:2-alkyl-3-oxoalkanoate reductase